MMDLVSGAEVPEAEIVVTPAMIEAGCRGAHVFLELGQQVCEIYRAMERTRRVEQKP